MLPPTRSRNKSFLQETQRGNNPDVAGWTVSTEEALIDLSREEYHTQRVVDQPNPPNHYTAMPRNGTHGKPTPKNIGIDPRHYLGSGHG